MTPVQRKSILRYGITVDLVVLATGVGWLFPEIPTLALVAVFALAAATAGLRGRWPGVLTAIVLSIAALAFFFHAPPLSLALFAGAALLLGGIVIATTRPAVAAPQETLAPPQDNVVAFEADPQRQERDLAAKLEAERRERKAAERKLEVERTAARKLEARLAKEREAAEKAAAKLAKEAEARAAREREEAEARLAKEREALAKEREALAREAEERAAKEREAAARAEQLAQQELEARLAAEREALAKEREALAREAEERAAKEREAAAKLAAEKEALEREAAARAEQLAQQELEARLAAEREALAKEREALAREAEERAAKEREAAAKLAAEKESLEREAAARAEQLAQQELEARLAAEREALAKEREALAREAQERAAKEREAAAKLAAEKEALEREAAARAQQELESRLAAEREALAKEREALAREAEQRAAKEREAEARAARETEARVLREREALAKRSEPRRPAAPPDAAKSSGLFSSIAGWFKSSPRPASGAVNLRTKRVAGNDTATRRARAAASAQPQRRANRNVPRKPRVLLLERRRGTADAILPKLRNEGIEAEVVERWVDAVDELFRFRPDLFLLDLEVPEIDKVHKALADNSPNLPVALTGTAHARVPAIAHAAFLQRPFDVDELSQLAYDAMRDPQKLLARQRTAMRPATTTPIPLSPASPPPTTRPAPRPAAAAKPAMTPKPVPAPPPIAAPAAAPVPLALAIPDEHAHDLAAASYLVDCFNCRVQFDAIESDWCSCLTKERTLVCTNCLACFCKAPPAFKEKFWLEAPPPLFERKTAELRRQQAAVSPNPAPDEVRRPLILLVEDDEDIQVIVNRVCSNLGYGFVSAFNGQQGLELARQYRPNLILSDAFMPKLDGREMCRILKEEWPGTDCRMIVMTGLYTDTKYKSEALKRFHIDDYLSKPVAITDLINLLQRHLEGVTGLPQQEDLHELHRQALIEDTPDGIPLAALLDVDGDTADEAPAARPGAYEVCCFTCNGLFEATEAEWCSCLGRDQTLVCPQCGNCFCKAPSAYRERFWVDAPPSLFERKMIGSRRQVAANGNPVPSDVRRPLILLVEDDENIQLIVKTVVTTMGYGFIVGADGQEGLTLAREYAPDLILSDAFMPKLDGREMCRLLKEDPSTARAKAIIMTGLYTDRKYRNEALAYFKVDDYVAKPLAVDDLIRLMKKHLPQDVQATM